MLAILRDITVERERELSSENARQTAALLRDTAGVTVWRYDGDTDEYDFNPDFTRSGQRASQAPGKISGEGVADRPFTARTRSLCTRRGAAPWRPARPA